MEFVGRERRDYASLTISSWRMREASKISHESKRSTCKTPSHLPRDLSKLVKIHAKDKKSIPISKSAGKILNLEHKLIKREKKLLYSLLLISTNPSMRLALTRNNKCIKEFLQITSATIRDNDHPTLEPCTT